MKKLLSLLAAAGLTASAGSMVVACSDKKTDAGDEKPPVVEKGDFELTGEQNINVYQTTKLTFEQKENMTDFKVQIESGANDEVITAEITDLEKGEVTVTGISKGQASVFVTAIEKVKTKDDTEVKTFKSDELQIVVEEASITEIIPEDTDLGEISKTGAPSKDQIKTVVEDQFKKELNGAKVTVTGRKDDKGHGTANVHVKGYEGQVNVKYSYINETQPPIKKVDITGLTIGKVVVGDDMKQVEMSIQNAINGLVKGTMKDTDYTITGNTKEESIITVLALDNSELITGSFNFMVQAKPEPELPEVDATMTPENQKIHLEELAELTVNTEGAIAHAELGKEDFVKVTKNENTNTWSIQGKKIGTVSIIVSAEGYKDKQFTLTILDSLATKIDYQQNGKLDTIKDESIFTIKNFNKLTDVKFTTGGALTDKVNEDGTYTVTAANKGEGTVKISAKDAEGGVLDDIELSFTIKGINIDTDVDTNETVKLNHVESKLITVNNIKDLDNFEVKSSDESIFTLVGYNKETGVIHIVAHSIDGEADLVLTADNAEETKIHIEVGEFAKPIAKIDLNDYLTESEKDLGSFHNEWELGQAVTDLTTKRELTNDIEKVDMSTKDFIVLKALETSEKYTGEVKLSYDLDAEPEVQNINIILEGKLALGEVDDYIQAYAKAINILANAEISQKVTELEHGDSWITFTANDKYLTGTATFTFNLKKPEPIVKKNLSDVIKIEDRYLGTVEDAQIAVSQKLFDLNISQDEVYFGEPNFEAHVITVYAKDDSNYYFGNVDFTFYIKEIDSEIVVNNSSIEINQHGINVIRSIKNFDKLKNIKTAVYTDDWAAKYVHASINGGKLIITADKIENEFIKNHTGVITLSADNVEDIFIDFIITPLKDDAKPLDPLAPVETDINIINEITVNYWDQQYFKIENFEKLSHVEVLTPIDNKYFEQVSIKTNDESGEGYLFIRTNSHRGTFSIQLRAHTSWGFIIKTITINIK